MNPKRNHWVRVRSEYGPDLKLFRARFDYMRNPRNEQIEPMIVLESHDSVNVVALVDPDHMLFVRQYRFGIEAETLELPGGIVDPGEDPRRAAARELQEETGFSGGSWSPLGKIPSNPVFQTAYIHHWLVEGVSSTHEQKLDEGEQIFLETLPLREVERRMHRGEFLHPHTLTALIAFFGRNGH